MSKFKNPPAQNGVLFDDDDDGGGVCVCIWLRWINRVLFFGERMNKDCERQTGHTTTVNVEREKMA